MNEDELAQIEQRYAAADKVAPMSNWQFVDSECNCDCGHVRFDDDDNDIEIDCESGECAECLKELKANQSGLLTQTDGDYWYFHPRTLMFILACRADIPALIAEVRRLRQELSDTNEELTISKRLKGMW